MAASGSPNSNRPRRDDGSSVAAGAIGRPSTSCVHTYARMHRAHKRLPANYFDEPCVDLGIYIRARYCRRVTGATSLVVGPRRRHLAFGRGLRTSRRLLPARPRSGFFPSARRHSADNVVVSRAACGNNSNDSSPPVHAKAAKAFILA